MKLNYETSRPGVKEVTAGDDQTANAGGVLTTIAEPKGFRRLKFNELVSLGDFVHDDSLGLQPWDGPRGFQAGSFVKPIYRPQRIRSTTPKATAGNATKKRK